MNSYKNKIRRIVYIMSIEYSKCKIIIINLIYVNVKLINVKFTSKLYLAVKI